VSGRNIQPVHSLLQHFQFRGAGQAKKMLPFRPDPAERIPIHRGYMMMVEDKHLEQVGRGCPSFDVRGKFIICSNDPHLVADSRNIGEKIKCATRCFAPDAVDFVQLLHDHISPVLEGLDHVFNDRLALRVLKGDSGALLNEGRYARKIVDVYILKCVCFLLRGKYRITDSPSGPCKGFGEPAAYDGPLLHTRNRSDGNMLESVKNDVLIDLIRVNAHVPGAFE